MPTEKEFLERIRQLEEQNSTLQDKLDMIWAILAPDYDEPDEEISANPGFVSVDEISGQNKQKP